MYWLYKKNLNRKEIFFIYHFKMWLFSWRVRLSCTVLGNKIKLLKRVTPFVSYSDSMLLSYVLPLEKNAEALIHWGLVLSSIHLAFLKGLDGAELTSEPLEQSFTYMQGFKHPLIHWSQLTVNLNLGIKRKWRMKFFTNSVWSDYPWNSISKKASIIPDCLSTKLYKREQWGVMDTAYMICITSQRHDLVL